MKMGMNIVNGLPEFFTEDEGFVQKASQYDVRIYNIRKAPLRTDLHNFTGRIYVVYWPVVTGQTVILQEAKYGVAVDV